MNFIADILLLSGALGCGFYCYVLSRRLSAFQNIEHGVGKAVADLSLKVDALNESVSAARAAALESQGSLVEVTTRAEEAGKRLELLVASMHDIPKTPAVGNTIDTPVFTSRVSRAG